MPFVLDFRSFVTLYIRFKFSVNEKHFDCTWICIVISHLNVFLDFINFSEFEILVGILVNESPSNNF